ncbi:hypothetical protein, partial [Campylobacter upsaliensis]|uniref:hypothetical protein n=1 Tax=Campylobacter upsaliensis TaxID=28080 RepID=UPI0022EB3DB8
MKYENLKEEEILNLAKKNALLSFYKNKLSNKIYLKRLLISSRSLKEILQMLQMKQIKICKRN